MVIKNIIGFEYFNKIKIQETFQPSVDSLEMMGSSIPD